MAAKQSPCTLPTSKAGKHAWVFEKNFKTATMRVTSHGSYGRLSVRGLYRCGCGGTRVGTVNPNAPNAGL